MNRREFMTLIGGAVALGRAPGACAANELGAKPNFVLFIADDLATRDVGCYGNTVIRTPNIDRLAREGGLFTHAFTTTAMCAPARSMLYTGLYPHRNGCHFNHGSVKPGVRSLPHYLTPLGYRVALAGKTHIRPHEAFPFEYMNQGQVETFLKSVDETPFCLVMASNEPHVPHQTGGYWPEQIILPPHLVDTPETRKTIADYYTDIDALDKEVGVCLSMLEKYGLADNTLFMFMSDHGDAMFAKWTCYEQGLNVPCIVRWPGKVEEGSVQDAMVSFVDVLPTFVEAGGGNSSEDIDGRSFFAVLVGRKDAHRDFIYGAHTTQGIISGKPYPVRSVRSRTHKYIRNLHSQGTFQNVMTHGRRYDEAEAGELWKSWKEQAKTDAFAAERVRQYQHRPTEELYDLRSDPYELKNLARDPAQKDLLRSMSQRLDAWMTQQGDKGLEAEEKVPPFEELYEELTRSERRRREQMQRNSTSR